MSHSPGTWARSINPEIPACEDYGHWPTWLTADEFAGWYARQNQLREYNGDAPLPRVPFAVLDVLED